MIKMKIKNLLLTLVLTLALLLSGTATVFATNHKSTNAFAEMTRSICYFGDNVNMAIRPTITTSYNSYYIKVFDTDYFKTIYDNQSQLFSSTNYNYFLSDGSINGMDNIIAVFEFTGNKPDPNRLEQLFSELKSNGCLTMMISAYPASCFTDLGFMEYLDQFEVYNVYNDFVDYAFDNMIYSNNSIYSDSIFLLDGRMVNDIDSGDLTTIYNSSYFLQCLINEIDQNTGHEGFEDISDFLLLKNIKILVHIGGNNFIDIDDGAEYSYPSQSFELSPFTEHKYYAFGFWELQTDLYNLFYGLQQSKPTSYTFEIYVLMLENMISSEGGLSLFGFVPDASYTENIHEALLTLLYSSKWDE